MKKGKILVTPRSLSSAGHPELKRLENAGFEVLTPFPGRQPTADELAAVLPECVAYLAGVEKITGDLLSGCPELKVISRNGVGVDNVDRDSAKKAGIAVTIASGANSRGVAELAIGLMFSLLRSLPQVNESVKSGEWKRIKGTEVAGRTIGVVGTGQIGRHVIRMGTGVGMEAVGYDPYPEPDLETQVPGFQYVSKEELFQSSDVVTLHCPGGDSPLIDGTVVASMKTRAFLVNTARAGLVDDDAVLAALECGDLAGYAVDAFATEPPELSPLLRHPRTILSAHIGGFTSVDRATSAAVDNILDIIS